MRRVPTCSRPESRRSSIRSSSSIRAGRTTSRPSPGHDGVTLVVANVIFNALQTGGLWTVDEVGYNFRHEINVAHLRSVSESGSAVPGPLRTDADHRPEVDCPLPIEGDLTMTDIQQIQSIRSQTLSQLDELRATRSRRIGSTASAFIGSSTPSRCSAPSTGATGSSPSTNRLKFVRRGSADGQSNSTSPTISTRSST